MHATVSSPVRATYVSLAPSGGTAHVDGTVRGCELLATGEVRWTSAPTVEDREEWDACHPGTEPTSANLLAVYTDVADDLIEQWVEMQRDAASEDFDDSGCDWNGRECL